ncbi:MAG: C10 family peptidase [Bacteroidaceae bacterium]|nr:C10 family peptidase [Bacteroidaceae bacterium]
MKRFCLFLMILFITATTVFAQQRSMDEVMRIAQSHMSQRTTRDWQRMAPPVETATTLRASEIVPTPLRMSSGEAFYVLTYPKSNCFVMVSGDERMSPVLAYSDEHGFDLDNMAPQTRALIESYAAYAQTLQSGAPRRLYVNRAPIDVTPQKVNNLLKTTWSQYTPYNNRCPLIGSQHTLTGCVATAIGQLMNFYKYPNVGIGNISYTTRTTKLPVSIDLSTINFSWNDMLNDYSGGYTTAQANAVSNLLFAVGASVHMDYGLDGSSSALGDAAGALIENFKYDKDILDIYFSRMAEPTIHQFIMKELIAGRPVPCGGNNAQGEGHSFIIDGMTPDGTDYPYYHFNWGWGGQNDGDFKIVNMEYCIGNYMLLNCQPENDVVDYAAFVQALSIEPSISKVNPEMTNSLSVRLKEVYNSKQGIFNGLLTVYLVGEDGTRIQIGDHGVQLEHPYYYPVNISCKVPKETPVGTYTLEVEAQDVESGASTTVYIAEDHPLIVTNEVVDYVPNVQVTRMDFVKNFMNDSTVCVTVKNLINLEAEAFKGDVSLALATENNKEICKLGTPIKITSPLDTYYYKESIGNLIGVVPDSVPDGVYHVIAMARQEGYEGWSWIKKYDVQGNTIMNAGQDLFLVIQIEEGKIKTDNIVVPQKYFADIETTEMILNEERCKGRTVSISISNYANLGEESFSGSLSLALADEDGNVLFAFGKPVNVSSLQSYGLRSSGITFEAEVPDTVSDGHYQLCIASQMTGFSNWTPLTLFTLNDGYIGESNVESFYDLWVIKGRPTLNLYKREDVNRDGEVDTQDVLTIYQFMQNSTGTEENPVEDVNGDGEVDTQDVLTIYTYMQEN